MSEFSEELLDDTGAQEIDDVLSGHIPAILRAFDWANTKQGVGHWNRIYSGHKTLDEESRSYLIKLRDAVLSMGQPK